MPRDGSPAPPSGPAQNKMQSSKKSVRNRCPATVVPSEASYMDLSLHTHTLPEADRDPLPPMAGPALRSAERRVGQGCVRTGRNRGSPCKKKKKKTHTSRNQQVNNE